MPPERREQVEQLYHAARTRAAGEERASYLDAACAGDAGLRREVDLLLAQQSSGTGGLLDGPTRTGSPSLPHEPSVSRLAAGSQLGPYQIHSLLGSGGMGQVYKAFDARLGRDVAIKVGAERFSERFDREVRAVASLNHPNICTVYDVGPNYLVMELVDGKTLREWFRGALPLERSLGIARQVLEALSTAHRAGVVHRDLKPENVMVRAFMCGLLLSLLVRSSVRRSMWVSFRELCDQPPSCIDHLPPRSGASPVPTTASSS
jgi:serine/threonine protein kinase